MEAIYNHRTSKIVESVIKVILDDYHQPRTEEYYNNETILCVASVLRHVFKEPIPQVLKEKKIQPGKLAVMIKDTIDSQPTFYTRSGQPIRAAGIICFVIDRNTGKKIWLLRESNGYLSDTGGKTDTKDECPMDTAIRETVEETNGHLFSDKHSEERCSQIISNHLPKQKNLTIYNKDSKYLLFTFELRYPMYLKSLKRFGTIEKKDNEKHSYRWYHKIPYERLHPRLSKIKNRIK